MNMQTRISSCTYILHCGHNTRIWKMLLESTYLSGKEDMRTVWRSLHSIELFSQFLTYTMCSPLWSSALYNRRHKSQLWAYEKIFKTVTQSYMIELQANRKLYKMKIYLHQYVANSPWTILEPRESNFNTWQYIDSCMIAYSGFVSKSNQLSICTGSMIAVSSTDIMIVSARIHSNMQVKEFVIACFRIKETYWTKKVVAECWFCSIHKNWIPNPFKTATVTNGDTVTLPHRS